MITSESLQYNFLDHLTEDKNTTEISLKAVKNYIEEKNKSFIIDIGAGFELLSSKISSIESEINANDVSRQFKLTDDFYLFF